MAIRWRLTLWFSLILLAILVFSGFLLSTVLRGYLYRDVDENLRSYTAEVHGTLHDVSSPLDYTTIHARLPAINEFSAPTIFIQITDPAGNAIVKSDNLVNRDLPLNRALIEKGLEGLTDIATVAAADGAQVRIMVSPLFLSDQPLVLEVAQSLHPVTAALSQFRLALIIGSLVALLLTVLLGALIVKRTLDPVENITRTAQGIAAGADLHRRVDYRGPNDEIGRLAKTFDRMIERLGRAFESQKQFVADASHELRTPLTVLRGNIDLLKRNISDEDRRESLRALENETRRMTGIVNDLLLLAEIEAGQTRRNGTVYLGDIVRQEIERIKTLAGPRKMALAESEPLNVPGDPNRMRQLVGNLIDNAVKYTGPEGNIEVSLRREGDCARLDVVDNGVGIPPEHLPHLFDRFYRVDKSRSRAGGGTGLGLAIVKGIAEQHGGKVAVESKPGCGTKFSVWLKASRSSPASNGGRATPPEQAG